MKSNIDHFLQNFSIFILEYIKCEFKYHQEFSSIYMSEKKRNSFFGSYSVPNIKISFFFSVYNWIHRYNYRVHTIISIIP